MARSLACSSMKRIPAFTKNEMRPNTRGNVSSGTLARTRSSTASAVAIA